MGYRESPSPFPILRPASSWRPASSRRSIRLSGLALALALLAGVSACGPTPKPEPPAPSPLELREAQTRSFNWATSLMLMRAVTAALQDEGFTIREANTELGLITAEKQLDAQEAWTLSELRARNLRLRNPEEEDQRDYVTVRHWDATVNVLENTTGARVRVSFVEKALNNQGGVLSSRPVRDPHAYQEFFVRVDKALFFLKNKV